VKNDDDYFKVENSVEDTEDGGALVSFDETPPIGTGKFYANLATSLDGGNLSIIGSSLFDLIEKDKKARERRDEQYEEGIRRTGLGEDAPGGAQFMGASKVVHPMLTEACVDFSSRVMKEVFPANGPAKSFIAGEATHKDIERGDRVSEYLNYQCLVQMPEMRAELERLTTQLPLGGGQYLKCSWLEDKQRPTVKFIPIDDIYLPYAATNFYTAERKTHVQYITRMEFERRVSIGMYRDIDMISDPLPPEVTKSGEATDRIEGRSLDAYNEDGLRTIYECFCLYELKEEEGAKPYIISIDQTTKQVLSIYRNWDEDDKACDSLDWIVEFSFLPWRGAYPIGLTHLIGGLSAAATGALRALLDSALINNFPGMLKLKGGIGGQTERPDPTQVMEIEGSIQDDDVRKLIMPMPFNPPSPVLFELLGFLQESGRQIVRTTMEETADSNQNTPVGTTLARLEQGMTVFSAIHARMHHSMARLLKVLYRINKFYLEEEHLYDETGKLLAKRSDFQGPMIAVPVSDPNIFSESQRFAQIQLVAQRAAGLPQLYNLRKVEELILERMKIPNVDDLLNPAQEGQETNAVNENLMATMGRPIVAFPEQDHMAHLETHCDFLMSPVLGMNPLIMNKVLPVLANHLSEHLTLWYVTDIVELADEVAGVPISELQKKATIEEKAKFDQMLSLASKQTVPGLQTKFQKYMPILQQVQQLLQQIQQQQQPQDPTVQLGMAKISSDEKIKQMELQAEAQKIQLEMQRDQQLEQLKQQSKQTEVQAKGQVDLQKVQIQAQVDTAKMDQESQQSAQVVQIEYMKQQAETQRLVMDLQNKIQLLEMELRGKAQLEGHKMQVQGELEDKKMVAAHQLEDKKMSHAKDLESSKQQSALQMEDSRQQSALQMENAKQASAHAIEDKKMSHAKDLELAKATGGLITQHMQHAQTMQAQRDTHAHDEHMQRRADTLDLYKHDTQMTHEQTQDALAKQHEGAESEKAREHEGQLRSEEQMHDMKKTKLVEKNKSDVAGKQLKLKEKEGKEQLKIKQSESAQKMAMKEKEGAVRLKMQEAEGQLKLKSQQNKAKLEEAYGKEEHRGKMDLMKAKFAADKQRLSAKVGSEGKGNDGGRQSRSKTKKPRV